MTLEQVQKLKAELLSRLINAEEQLEAKVSELTIHEGKKKEKSKEWKFGKGIKGTVRAAITKHSDKFDKDCKDPDRLCPYAVFAAKKKKGMTAKYKDQPSTLKGKPKKRKRFQNECFMTFEEWLPLREDCGKPHPITKMQKIDHEEKKRSPKVRDLRDDLSSDYKGHIKHNGTVEPFKVFDKRTLRRS